LKERVLYHDTDSIIYKIHDDDGEIITGSSLGQWEDECKNPQEDWLIEFVSIGPNYYRTGNLSYANFVRSFYKNVQRSGDRTVYNFVKEVILKNKKQSGGSKPMKWQGCKCDDECKLCC